MAGPCKTSNENNWNQEFLNKIVDVTTKNVLKWCNLINQLGLETQARQRWVTILTDFLQETYENIIQEAVRQHNALLDEIENLLKQSSELCKELHLEMPDYGSQQLNLCEKRRVLKERIQEHETLLDAKRKEIEELNSQEKQLCRALNRPAKGLRVSPLSDSDAVDEFKDYLETLEFEKYERIIHFSSVKDSILELANELNFKPSLEFEKIVMSSPDELDFVVSDSVMTRLDNFYDSLKTQLTDVKQEVASLREKITHLWEKLNEDPKYFNEFIQQHTGNTIDTLEALKKELERCETLRRSNIEVFIKDSRKILVESWNKCHFTEAQRDFKFFHADLYTEDLLTLHDIEIQKLERFFSENEKILILLEERKNLWEKMAMLKQQMAKPERYKNRGGQLLREEKERNALLKRIPRIEEQLLRLAKVYETRNGKPFLSWGETIDTIISNDHAGYEEEMKIKLNARKLRHKAISPGKFITGLTSCAGTQNLIQHGSNTGTKRKIEIPLFSGRHPRVLADINENAVPRRAPPTLTVNDRPIGPSRYSQERGKRIARCRQVLRKKLSKKNVSGCSTNYGVFEKYLENKENCCSTKCKEGSENGPLALALPITPRRRQPPQGTPRGSNSRAQNSHNAVKLTTSSLKLLF